MVRFDTLRDEGALERWSGEQEGKNAVIGQTRQQQRDVVDVSSGYSEECRKMRFTDS